MPLEKGWGWNPKSRRYTASGDICENDKADGYGLEPLAFQMPDNAHDEECDVEEEDTEKEDNEVGVGKDMDPIVFTTRLETSGASSTPYRHAGAQTPKLLESEEPAVRPLIIESVRPKSVQPRDTVEGICINYMCTHMYACMYIYNVYV